MTGWLPTCAPITLPRYDWSSSRSGLVQPCTVPSSATPSRIQPPRVLASEPAEAEARGLVDIGVAGDDVGEVRRIGRLQCKGVGGRLVRGTEHGRLAGVWAVVKQTYQEFSKDNGTLMAAAVAFYILLSLVPMVLVALALFGWMRRRRAGANPSA